MNLDITPSSLPDPDQSLSDDILSSPLERLQAIGALSDPRLIREFADILDTLQSAHPEQADLSVSVTRSTSTP